ncbi:MAG TPA: serine/threonine-protein kinase [Enhygromyxa sp.]|nr:serine/threonine-protein kinase [Enhygromyxa sp.]
MRTVADVEQATTEKEGHCDATIPDATVELFDDFEQQRLLASIHNRLFGHGSSVRIGRYRVERRLGAGAMGEVYLAVDEELDRKVAIKRVLAGHDDLREQQRLRREARALARLTHANVVQVYEVGEHDGRTFIAMQYVAGRTLAEWLSEDRRPWPAILERFIAAGRGLAAVHRAGLVHRDFKPDNVLLGEGEVRVVDFGLVLAGDDRLRGSEQLPSPAAIAHVSITGALMGTIRYMPLEQLRGEIVDARSDQFSFCVALYEALWGRAPFELDSTHTRARALARGVPIPPDPGLPAGLWWVIRRGLSRDPQQRWPDMESLIVALDRVPRRRRALAWAAATVLMAGIGIGIAALADERDQPEDPCATIERELAGVWDQHRRARLEARFVADPTPHAEHSRVRVLDGLDRWARAWVAEREQVCRQSNDGSLAPQLAQLRGACLIRQQMRARALVELLTDADSAALTRAIEAVAELQSPASCETELALLGVEAPAANIAATVEEIRTDLDRAHEMRLLGRFTEAHALAEQGLGRAIELDYGPLLAEANAELGKAEIVGGSLGRGIELLRSAIDLAEVHHHDHLAASLWIELALRVLVDLDDLEAGARELERASVAHQRAGRSSARLDARLHFARATLASARDDHAGAEQELRAAIGLIEDEAGPDLSSYLDSLARVVERRDRDEALALRRAALEAAEASFGDAHPQTAAYLYEFAVALQGDGRADEATPLLERAVEIWTSKHLQPHPNLALAERTLAQLALRRGDLDAAEAHARSLATVQAAILPAGHHELGDPELLLAAIEGMRGDDEAALAHCQAAIEQWESTLSSSDGRLTQARSRAASHLLALGRREEAARLYEQVVAHAKPRFAIPAHDGLAELALLSGRHDLAVAHLEAIDRLIADDPALLGSEALAHALLWALTDLRRGRALDARIRTLQAARRESSIGAAQLEAWLVQLGLTREERRSLGLEQRELESAQ